MNKFYKPGTLFFIIIVSIFFLPSKAGAQVCNSVSATYSITESRCAATGTVQINATGGSGNYQYKLSGPVNTNYTSSSLITGLTAGNYLVTIRDIVANCIYANDSVSVPGNYLAPTFAMVSTDVTCLNGYDGTISVTSQNFGRAPFTYKIVNPSTYGVGTISNAGVFTGLPSGSYYIQLTDSCGAIQTRGATILNYDWFINNYQVTKIGCDSIAVNINLIDIKNNQTPNPVFNGFQYGASANIGDTSWYNSNSFHYFIGTMHAVKLFVKDRCGNIKWVHWVDTSIPNVNASVSVSDKTCSTFTATVIGRVNLTNPSYCIYDNGNVLLSCNTSGTFTKLDYGSYCIKITNTCYDTTITRCFVVNKPIPAMNAQVNINANCNNFTAAITGQINLNDPKYCLFDAWGTMLYCNSTGVFTNLAFGYYCIQVANDPACYDTTIIRCFSVTRPIPSVGPNVNIINRTCSTFTAVIADTLNLTLPQYCIYNSANVLITCNSTGVFHNLRYGSYCIDVINSPTCYDTTITRCFTVARPIPSVNSQINVTNKTCTKFDAVISGQNNLNNPSYCIYDSTDLLIACNTNGIFANLPFGSYCIRIFNDPACYDTVLIRCFTVNPNPIVFILTANRSCSFIGRTDLKVNVTQAALPYTVSLYDPGGNFLQSIVTWGVNTFFIGLPNLPGTEKYKVVVTDQCGVKDSMTVLPLISTVERAISIARKCPTGIWPNGSADVVVNITNNNLGGDIRPQIIKKNNVAVSIFPSTSNNYVYTFINLAPAIYIFDTYVTNCNKHIYDTVTVVEYLYPLLTGSKAYQCNNNSFVVNVNVNGGLGPFTYEIIGSVPSSPSIVMPPQLSPVFNINNGTIYSLIRIRAIDACSNAGLHDLGVLPLANFLVSNDSLECFNHSLTLRVDSIALAQYTWYKRIVPNDSIVVGTGPSYTIPVLTIYDTGRYFCKIVINNGCLTKFANYIVTGTCGVILPSHTTLYAVKGRDGNSLIWNGRSSGVARYEIQKSVNAGTSFETIGRVPGNGDLRYSYLDRNPPSGNNYYRLKLVFNDHSFLYTNTVKVVNSNINVSAYPNPVDTKLFISINGKIPKNYQVELITMSGQKILSNLYTNVQNLDLVYLRKPDIQKGVYMLIVTDLEKSEKQTLKIIYK